MYDENYILQLGKLVDRRGKFHLLARACVLHAVLHADVHILGQRVDLAVALRQLESNPNKDNDNLTRASAEALASLFRTWV